MLTGRPNNYVRIPESQYQADIAAAEERGRASVSRTQEPTQIASAATAQRGTSEPTQEQKAAMEEVKLLQAAYASEADAVTEAARLQAYVNEQKKQGRKVSLAQASAEINKK
jgi:hypothetical protein